MAAHPIDREAADSGHGSGATPMSDPGTENVGGFTRGRLVALVAIGLIVLALGLLRFGPDEGQVSVPDGSVAGDLILDPCTYDTEDGARDAECGTLVVPENRNDPQSRLIALPVTRIPAQGDDPAEPVFRLQGGPGISNIPFPEASRLNDRHDVVLVGYRGVEGSTVLDCPEVESALKRSSDFGGEESFRRYSDAFAECVTRLTNDGVDLEGYSLPQRVDDLEAVRTALGYDRINLISESVGTRTAMIYSWRYPESINRSVMVAVNPPGRFLWDPEATDDLLRYLSGLCAKDDGCAGRTDDLFGSMRSTSAEMPDRWLFLPIKDGNVRAATLWGLFETTDEEAPLNSPTTVDAWLAEADGDPSGLWLISLLADLAFPESFVWGEFAATGIADAAAADAYYAAGGDPGSVLRNTATDFLWGGGDLTDAWPASRDYDQYRQVQASDVETLLVSGTIDFSTPPRFATDELLPSLANGRQVILPEFGHSADFWEYQPEASTRLITTFYETGTVDDSLYATQQVDFDAGVQTFPTLAKVLLGTMLGLALLGAALLGWMALRVHRRGRIGSTAGAWLRTLSPIPTGLGGWFLGALVVMSVWPSVPLDNQALAVLAVGVPVGLGIYLAWTDRDWSAPDRRLGLGLTIVAALVGAWAGFNATSGLLALVTAIVGAAAIANLALIILDIVRERRADNRLAAT
jgi:pimeloyl-ACP methyl ester carboxylesterase